MACIAQRLIGRRDARASAASLPQPDALAAEETALFCIGAHMSGLPLNHQLTALGARFLSATQTAATYRLYALGNRPGMLRAADGAAIEGEVWALPTAAIGALLAQVPAPLGFGTVELVEGLAWASCRRRRVSQVRAISHAYGGWRAWLAAKERHDRPRRS